MGTNLAATISTHELEPGTAVSRSFLIVEGGKTEPTELYGLTRAIHGLVAPERQDAQERSGIGYPGFVLGGVDGISHASISTGVDSGDATPFWQINVGGGGEYYTLHGQVTEEGEDWGLISADHQGRLRREATIEDGEPGQLAAFVVGAIKQAPLGEVVTRLTREKKIASAQYASYLAALEPTERYGYSGNNLVQIHGCYANTGFTGPRPNNLQHVIVSGFHRRAASQLPELVKRLLGSSGYEVTVPVSAPRNLKNGLYI